MFLYAGIYCITVHPAKCQERIQDSEIIHYKDDIATGSHAVRRAQIFTLRAPFSATVVWPGEYLELDIPVTWQMIVPLPA